MVAAAAAAAAVDPVAAAALALARKHNCLICHGLDNRVVGPALVDISRKYAARPDAAEYLAAKIRAGGSGIWGRVAMPAQALPESDARAIAKWLAEGARR